MFQQQHSKQNSKNKCSTNKSFFQKHIQICFKRKQIEKCVKPFSKKNQKCFRNNFKKQIKNMFQTKYFKTTYSKTNFKPVSNKKNQNMFKQQIKTTKTNQNKSKRCSIVFQKLFLIPQPWENNGSANTCQDMLWISTGAAPFSPWSMAEVHTPSAKPFAQTSHTSRVNIYRARGPGPATAPDSVAKRPRLDHVTCWSWSFWCPWRGSLHPFCWKGGLQLIYVKKSWKRCEQQIPGTNAWEKV